jgi:hypothetical protein
MIQNFQVEILFVFSNFGYCKFVCYLEVEIWDFNMSTTFQQVKSPKRITMVGVSVRILYSVMAANPAPNRFAFSIFTMSTEICPSFKWDNTQVKVDCVKSA